MQNYKNHVRYYYPHHFVFYPLALFGIIFGAKKFLETQGDIKTIWGFLIFLSFLIIFLGFMTRQHYALDLQNRIVILEQTFRYFRLTGKNLEDENLTDSQIFALRFSDDNEFLKLIKIAQEKNLSADEIKRSIKNWKGDYKRV